MCDSQEQFNIRSRDYDAFTIKGAISKCTRCMKLIEWKSADGSHWVKFNFDGTKHICGKQHMESYDLVFNRQTKAAIACHIIGNSCFDLIWLPKSQIEVDGVKYDRDFDNLSSGEVISVYIPDWLAEEKELR